MAKEKNVKYEYQVVDELPDRPARSSQIEEQLAKLKADRSVLGKYVCIAQYALPTAATAAANILRKRHGKEGVAGWWFGTRKVKDPEDGSERTGLYVSYDPARIVPGEAETHAKEKAEREQRNRERLAAKKAEAKATKAGGNKRTPAAANA